jgi:transcriptional antiterminator RfaH
VIVTDVLHARQSFDAAIEAYGPEHVLAPALLGLQSPKGFIQLDSRSMFAPGDKVRVLTGAFADTAGLFGGLADHDRVSILLDMLGRKARVFLDVDMIAVA